jgi:pimeloyl-ACP methyl ester carboxylesterase
VRQTLVDVLLDEGYDVWVENWRASIDFPNNSYTLDQGARLDHPRAVETVRERTGAERVRVVAHCQGSVGFLMAAVAGYLPEDSVSHVVSSAISLFFDVPKMTTLKEHTVLRLAELVGRGADASWAIRAPTPFAKMIAEVATHVEERCGNPACQMANFMYGSGNDVLLLHPNVDDRVHRWSARELGYAPFSLIQQVADSCDKGEAVRARSEVLAPKSYVSDSPKIKNTRFLFLGGERNRMFFPRGQERAAEFLKGHGLDAEFLLLKGYGHLDTFWGRDAASDVFPHILSALEP